MKGNKRKSEVDVTFLYNRGAVAVKEMFKSETIQSSLKNTHCVLQFIRDVQAAAVADVKWGRRRRRRAKELMVRIAHFVVLFQVTFCRNECYASRRANEAFCHSTRFKENSPEAFKCRKSSREPSSVKFFPLSIFR
ncbi:hypothetical protein TcasGA2_TC000696 [Tribolium castaneum]|uniref:Uncharacterized protein n=1 Tax=Tribolium castaneum TaxID=7070 RepID=D6W8U8_TRICA|nr:hypothetical protein TcasGA2_TC000696 [Tribolium castaneum]